MAESLRLNSKYSNSVDIFDRNSEAVFSVNPNYPYNPTTPRRGSSFVSTSDLRRYNSEIINKTSNKAQFSYELDVTDDIKKKISKVNDNIVIINKLIVVSTLAWVLVINALIAVSIIGYLTPGGQTGYICYQNNKNTIQKLYKENCLTTYECRNDLGLTCQNSMCLCKDVTYYWNYNTTTCIKYLGYLDNCTADSECGSYLICSSQNNCNCPSSFSSGQKCDCKRNVGDEYFWDGNICKNALSYGNTCTNDYMCQILTENTTCNGSPAAKCSCSSQKYYKISSKRCVDQLLNSNSCPQGDECRADLGLTCPTGICNCNSTTQFWNGTRCINYYTYNTQTCSNTNQCEENLICRTSGTSCICPSLVSNNKCDCPFPVVGSEYYWNGVSCVLAASYGETCVASKNYTCRTLEQNTYCNSSGLCDCDNSVWSSASNQCVSCDANWEYYRGYCFRISSINFLGKTAVVQSGCYNNPNSQLGKILTSDLSGGFFNRFLSAVVSKFYFDAFRVSANVFKSLDGTITYNSATWPRNTGEDFAVYRSQNFEDDPLHLHLYLCQYQLI